ncbi:MAG: TrmH family RNA methyltransferase [Streptococcus salivarius]
MGNEGQGISQDMAKSADQLVHISMPGQAESLNVLLQQEFSCLVSRSQG